MAFMQIKIYTAISPPPSSSSSSSSALLLHNGTCAARCCWPSSAQSHHHHAMPPSTPMISNTSFLPFFTHHLHFAPPSKASVVVFWVPGSLFLFFLFLSAKRPIPCLYLPPPALHISSHPLLVGIPSPSHSPNVPEHPHHSAAVPSAFLAHGRRTHQLPTSYSMIYAGPGTVFHRDKHASVTFVGNKSCEEEVESTLSGRIDGNSKTSFPGNCEVERIVQDAKVKNIGSELLLEAWFSKLKQEEKMKNVESETLVEDWLCKLKQEAIQRGVDRDVVEKVLAGITISEEILKTDLNKPEVKLSAEAYIKRFVSDYRISKGLVAFKEHLSLLNEVAGKYGVPSPVLVAIWGIESNYGAFTGNWDTVQAVLTLAYGSAEQRRASFFREELIHLLRIIEQGHARPGDRRLKGSWAGAMGQCQFMPSSFQTYAVDYDGDGCKDIWESHADVFASIANYLQLHGWKNECPIAQKVTVPETIDTSVFGLTVKKTLAEWNDTYKLQVLEKEGFLQDETASLVAPDGVGGPVYLVFNNFTTIMRYNPSVLYALAVYELSNIIANNSEAQT